MKDGRERAFVGGYGAEVGWEWVKINSFAALPVTRQPIQG